MRHYDIIDQVKRNHRKTVKAMLDWGADVNTQDEHHQSLLLIATSNRLAKMAELLVKYGADVNMISDSLESPFLHAGASGQLYLVKLFLANGARFDVFNRYHGSALIPACERGHVETVRTLVQTQGFPIDHINRLGWTALLEAVILGDGSRKYQKVVQLLKDAGADLSIADDDGITALEHARNSGYKGIVKILED